MGIRYYAYPIAAGDYETAHEDPCPFHGSDPFAPREVHDVSSDIATVGDDEIRNFMAHRASRPDDEQEFSYVQHFLGEAQKFVAALADDGRGLVYMIG